MIDPKIEARINQVVDMRVRQHERWFMAQGTVVAIALLLVGEVFRRVVGVNMVELFLSSL